ncbi:MAG TPA: hypothetical protein VL021_02490 [Brumimicrobium sp.]|nr:hypothetical protein [Brumimicrobium sp.]
MGENRNLTLEEKTLKINLQSDVYGSFSEIGAGQEVVANFFRAGGSSGTIAFSRSAYDMKVSDSIYGKAARYVSEERLRTMLNHEFDEVTKSLDYRKEYTRFFAFCNTVESLNYHKTNQGHGWIGIRFQSKPNTRPNNIILHVKMHDQSNTAQQEALGILGVNLIYATYFNIEDNLDKFVDSLVHTLPKDRIEIDMLNVEGPDFEHFDNRMVALTLVKKGITEATMFDQTGRVLQPADELYKKSIILIRGRFRPVTKVNIDMLERTRECFYKEEGVEKKNVREIFELTLRDLTSDGKIAEKDFIDRTELLGALGYTVMISNYLKYYEVVDYLSEVSRNYKIGVLLGIYNLNNIFNEEFYSELNGGILEAFGKGFGRNSKLYIYPAINYKTGELFEFKDYKVPENLEGLLKFMIDNDKIEGLTKFEYELLKINADEVLEKIQTHQDDDTWDSDVPDRVAKAIKFMRLFGYQPKVEPEPLKFSNEK